MNDVPNLEISLGEKMLDNIGNNEKEAIHVCIYGGGGGGT